MRPLIVCDLGGVVVRIDPRRCHSGWSELSGLSVGDVAQRLYPDDVHDAFERGEVSARGYLDHVRQQLGTDTDDDTLAACFNDIYGGIDQDVLAVLAACQLAGSRLVALTNTNPLHHGHWWPMYRDDLAVFDHIYLSFELGARKPEPAAFQAVLDAEEAAPDEAVFIDDVAGHVQAARDLGLPAIHYRSANDLSDHLAAVSHAPEIRLTDRLLLEPLGHEHVDDLVALHRDPRVAAWFDGPWSKQDAQARTARAVTAWEEHGTDRWMAYDRMTGTLVGRGGVAVTHVDGADRFEVGWVVRQDLWGCGYATEMGREALTFAFDHLKADEVVAFTEPDNHRSRAVMSRLGMHFAREIRHADRTMVLYIIRAQEA